MSKSFSVDEENVIIYKDGKERKFRISTVKGACLKVLVENIHKPMEVSEICKGADDIFKQLGKPPFLDRGRDIRSLHTSEGIIQKDSKGRYLFTGLFNQRNHNPFPPELKQKIFERDNFECRWCGLTQEEGAELMADHIKPESKGGKATLENGQTLCTRCNNKKSNYDVRTFGKKIFMDHLEKAKKNNMQSDIDFFSEILEIFHKHGQK